ncbi:MAG: preprotein translocase subunit SecY [Oscillospiraceae bacterium]|nr:preprotein translocase subunit SecY [Oscillospiraceae bacterium]
MFETFRNAWKNEDLRKRILFTIFIIVIYRIGSVFIPVPFLDGEVLRQMLEMNGGSIFSYMDILSGGSLSNATVFALSITPIINAQIIMQLLTYALPPLERLSKEGETGRKRLQKITDIVAIGIALLQGFGYYVIMKNYGAVQYVGGSEGIFAMIVIIACFVAGSSIVVWLGNQINEFGLGNGISLILFAGIIARGPSELLKLITLVKTDMQYIFLVLGIVVVFVLMIAFVVFMNSSERRIPIQYAKRVVGRRQYGGQSTHIPIKVAATGVMPIIFAMTFMSIPQTLQFIWDPQKIIMKASTGVELTGLENFYLNFLNFFNSNAIGYAIIYFLLIIAFNYFYVSMSFNPVEIANGLRQSNGGIPGIRPGKPTSDYIARVLSHITLVGAFFLGIIAILPIVTQNILRAMGVADVNIAMGGTSVLIIVSVALDLVRTLESQLMMRHHKGFLQ